MKVLDSMWTRVAAIEECPDGEAREFVVEGQIVALFNVEGTIYAMDGICPHQGGPLGQGALQGCVVTCPWHGWQYNVTTGAHMSNRSIVHPTLPVRVDDGQVFVDLGG